MALASHAAAGRLGAFSTQGIEGSFNQRISGQKRTNPIPMDITQLLELLAKLA
jgi:hypothetical protein